MREPAAQIRDLVKTYGSGDALVRALDGVSLDLEAGRFTAIMGPSGSGKSTLMHCAAALDRADSGTVRIGDQDLSSLGDKALTRLRRDRIGFIFQAYNLVPTLSAEENIRLPQAIAGRKPDPQWYDEVVDTVGLRDRLTHRPASSPAASSNGSRSPGRWSAGPRSCSPTSPPATSTAARGAEILELLRRSVDDHDQTVVMVTHDPVPRRTPTASSSSPTAAWSTSCASPTASRSSPGWQRSSPWRPTRPSLPEPEVVRAAWKSLMARKVRLAMSTSAIALGVAFVVGSLVFSAALSKGVDKLFASAVGDVVVRPAGSSTPNGDPSTRTVPASLARRLAEVPGAARADGNVSALGVFVIGRSGKVIGGLGAPTYGLATPTPRPGTASRD